MYANACLVAYAGGFYAVAVPCFDCWSATIVDMCKEWTIVVVTLLALDNGYLCCRRD